MRKVPFKSTHNLPFETAPWVTTDFIRFRIGTCAGLWRATPKTYDILAISNSNPRNGHFTDVLEWFEQSCIRDKRDLQILEVWNLSFKGHLIKKRGFQEIPGSDNIVKDLTSILNFHVEQRENSKASG